MLTWYVWSLSVLMQCAVIYFVHNKWNDDSLGYTSYRPCRWCFFSDNSKINVDWLCLLPLAFSIFLCHLMQMKRFWINFVRTHASHHFWTGKNERDQETRSTAWIHLTVSQLQTFEAARGDQNKHNEDN